MSRESENDQKRGVNEAAKDEADTPPFRNARAGIKPIADETEKKKAKKGGRIKKHVGDVEGEKHRAHGGRTARKAGGSCEASPFSSARHGTPATGRRLEKITEG